MLKYYFLFACALLLVGCETGPRIEYRYFPPNTDSGLLCVAMCQNARGHCKQVKDSSYQHCQMQKQLNRVRDENCRLQSKEENKYACYQPTFDTCWSPNYEECAQQYRECYQNCGGEVEAYTVKE